ncbi:hypothetical protein Tco_1336070 [Tanacetum coccineum]
MSPSQELRDHVSHAAPPPDTRARAMGGSDPFEEALAAMLGLFKPSLAHDLKHHVQWHFFKPITIMDCILLRVLDQNVKLERHYSRTARKPSTDSGIRPPTSTKQKLESSDTGLQGSRTECRFGGMVLSNNYNMYSKTVNK